MFNKQWNKNNAKTKRKENYQSPAVLLKKTAWNIQCRVKGSKENVYKQMVHKQKDHTGVQHLILECATY